MTAAPSLRIAITGASGLIGTRVAGRLRDGGHTVLRMVRRPAHAADEVEWDPDGGTVDAARLEGIRGVVHLAGANLAERWTEENKARFIRSRVRGTAVLVDALRSLPEPRGVLVAASAIGIYGADRGDEVLTEDSSPGDDFLGQLGQAWEGAALQAGAAGMRVVCLRFGPVLSREGGMLGRMLLPFRLGLGGRVGSGRQWLSWISIEDVVDLVVEALHDHRMRGPYNAVAGAATNLEFTRTLGRVLHRPTLLPAPIPALELVYGREMVRATLLASQRVEPKRLRELGHTFRHPDLESALRAALAE